MSFEEILTLEFLGNSVKAYFYAGGIFLMSIFGLWLFKKIIVVRLRKIAQKTKTQLDDLLVKILASAGWPLFYVLLSLYLALKAIAVSTILNQTLYYMLMIIIVYLLIKASGSIIEYGADRLIEKKEKEKKGFDKTMIFLLSKAAKALVWIVAIVLLFSNLGYDVSTLVAGLGIGGIAFAFAFKKILEDIFASFSIYFDRPFEIGDFIVIGKDAGTVKHIGIKSTRIQMLQGQELIMPNKKLTEERVNNYKKMRRRRIVFNFGVTYETPTAKLKKIPEMVKKIINDIEVSEADRVHFKEFADFSLNYEVVYYINSKDYNIYMDTQEAINLKVKEVFEKEGVSMAYPTQTVFVRRAQNK